MQVPFSPPDISKIEVKEVGKALLSGWITTGPRVKELEKKLAAYIFSDYSEGNVPRCVCLNSQTACAEMVLHLMGIGANAGGSSEDEVIVPAYTYTASASVVRHVGAKLVLIDSQKDGVEMDYDAVEKAINEKTKAIIPVDLGGIPCNYDRIFEIVEKKKKLFKPANDIQQAIGRVAVLADTAHALGAKWYGQKIGNIADFSSFSFHAVKNFTTGEGGAVMWRPIKGVSDCDIYHRLQLLSLHGQSKDALAKTQLGAWEYDIVDTFYKCNMTDITAAMGLGQLQRYSKLLARRKEIIERYDNAFKPFGIKSLSHYTDTYSSSGHLYITRLFHKDGSPISGEERNAVITTMAENGISCNVHYKPLPMHTAYKNLGFNIKDFPNAFNFFENEITLPLHTCLTDKQVKYVIDNYTGIVSDLLK